MTGTRLARILMVMLLTVAGRVTAAPVSVFMEDLTWTELRDAVRGGYATVLVPIGGTEQSGPHLALGKHNVRARVLAGRIARSLGNALVAPVIAYVPEGNIEPPTEHMRFPGTISIAPTTFAALLDDTARSLRAAGFRDIVFLGDHGGYQKQAHAAADRLNRVWAKTGVRAHALEAYYRAADAGFADILRGRGFTDAEIGLHAGLADTALMLAIDPKLVRSEQLATAATAGAGSGVRGDPRRASAELGALGVDAIVAASVQAIRRAVTRP